MAISDLPKTVPAGFVRGPTCIVCSALGSLPPKEATALRALLSDPAWRYQELSDRLADEGLDLSAGTLSWHARGRCAAREKLRGVR